MLECANNSSRKVLKISKNNFNFSFHENWQENESQLLNYNTLLFVFNLSAIFSGVFFNLNLKDFCDLNSNFFFWVIESQRERLSELVKNKKSVTSRYFLIWEQPFFSDYCTLAFLIRSSKQLPDRLICFSKCSLYISSICARWSGGDRWSQTPMF